MKIRIYLYESDGDLYTDPYTESEKIEQDYKDAELFEFEIEESKIKEETEDLVISSYWYDVAVLKDERLKGSMIELSHRIVNDMAHAVELANFKKFLHESARKLVIKYMVDELRQQVLTENKK